MMPSRGEKSLEKCNNADFHYPNVFLSSRAFRAFHLLL